VFKAAVERVPTNQNSVQRLQESQQTQLKLLNIFLKIKGGSSSEVLARASSLQTKSG
jgi:hypothetical protein